MTYKMNPSKEFSFKMPRVISQLHAAHITIYYLAFGWNSSLLTTLGKSRYIFHKTWVLDLLLKTLLSEWTRAICCIPVVITTLKPGTFAKTCGGRLKEKVFIENIFKSWCLVQFSELRYKYKYKYEKWNANQDTQVSLLSKFTRWKLQFFGFVLL